MQHSADPWRACGVLGCIRLGRDLLLGWIAQTPRTDVLLQSRDGTDPPASGEIVRTNAKLQREMGDLGAWRGGAQDPRRADSYYTVRFVR